MKKELLAPAGNMECLKAAVFNGADAVYMACKSFGARKFANNFDNNEIVEAIKFCHLYGVKAYVTMNTLIKNEEVNSFIEQAEFLYRNGVDAILIQDFGMICLLREKFPKLEIHASTQANTSSYETAKFYYDLGVKRVVFSREVSIDEIDSIDVPIEKEAFVHGALCISYSGECLMSSMLGGRSGNRGECAGCCRLPYTLLDGTTSISNEKYLLSTKELNTTQYIDRLINSSIYSLKIEGRMKSPLYVGFITKLYRRLLDGEKVDLDFETDKLKTIFNRKFTKGRLFSEDDASLMNQESPNHQGLVIGNSSIYKDKIKINLNRGRVLYQNDAIRFVNSGRGMMINFLYDKDMKLCSKADSVCYVDNKLNISSSDIVSKTQDYNLEKEFKNIDSKKIEVSFSVVARIGHPLKVSISDGYNNIVEEIGCVNEAKNAPADDQTIISKLSKLGDTPFTVSNIKIEKDENVFIQIKLLNDIRRILTEKLISMREKSNINFESCDLVFEKSESKCSSNDFITCLVYTDSQIRACLDMNVSRIYVCDKKLYDKYQNNSNIYYMLPRCIFNMSESFTSRNLVSDYFNFSDIDAYGNYSLNVFNVYTAYYLRKYGLKNIPISVELSEEEIDNFIKLYNNKFGYAPFEVLGYGRVENMIIKGNILNISTDISKYKLKDFKNRLFPVFYDGINTHILNYENFERNNLKNCIIRLDFYDESYEEIIKIIKSYQ